MTSLLVRASDGLRVPREDAPRRHIAADPVAVPDTLYYRRRLAAGDLVLDTEPEVAVGAASDPVPTPERTPSARRARSS